MVPPCPGSVLEREGRGRGMTSGCSGVTLRNGQDGGLDRRPPQWHIFSVCTGGKDPRVLWASRPYELTTQLTSPIPLLSLSLLHPLPPLLDAARFQPWVLALDCLKAPPGCPPGCVVRG